MSRAIPRPFGESNNKPTDEEHQYHLQRLTEYLRANDIPISNLSNDNSLNIRKSVYSEEELQAQAAAAQLLKQNAQPPKMTLNDLINQTWQNISPETLSPAQVTPPYNQELYDKAYNWQNKILAQPSFGQPYLQQDNPVPLNTIPVPEKNPRPSPEMMLQLQTDIIREEDNILYPYLDKVGKPTVCAGDLITDYNKYPWYIEKTKQPATPKEIQIAANRLKELSPQPTNY